MGKPGRRRRFTSVARDMKDNVWRASVAGRAEPSKHGRAALIVPSGKCFPARCSPFIPTTMVLPGSVVKPSPGTQGGR